MHPLKALLAFLLVPAFLTSLHAQAQRNNYQARLEIDDVVLHGAGQSPAAFEQYFDYMPADHKPVLYMYYIALKAIRDEFWIEDLRNRLDQYPDHFIVPQIGLSMSDGNNPNSNYEDEVAAGLYNTQISHLVRGLEKLGRPAYLRIGYEFNGSAWNGYGPATYVAAFRRITDSIRQANLEVATVWCSVVGGGTDSDYPSYYPGNSYVDWWAIDLFSVTDFSENLTNSFLADAHSANKPVMIGETTPRFIGADDSADWYSWFTQYYAFIENNPGIKATCYINWNWPEWTSFPQWSTWGNAELAANDFVRVNYVHRLRQNAYFGATSHEAFRQALPYTDTSPPAGVTIQQAGSGELPIRFQWNPVTDNSGVVYEVYKNGLPYATTYEAFFTDYEYAAGDTIRYALKAMDWAGNASPVSNVLSYALRDTIRKTVNSTFQDELFPWSLDTYSGAASSYQIPASGPLAIDIANSTLVNWQVQLVQVFSMLKQNTYFIRARMAASPGGQAVLTIQQAEAPFQLPVFFSVSAGPAAANFSTNPYTAPEDDEMRVGVFLGSLSSGTDVTIEELSLFEIDGRSGVVDNIPPQAHAGADILYTDLNQPLNLNGSGSLDPDGSISSYSWEQLSGTRVLTLQQPASANAAVLDIIPGEYVFRLTAVDNQGAVGMDEINVVIDSSLVSIDLPADARPLRIWPNPSTGLIELGLPGPLHSGRLLLQVVDAQGRTVANQATAGIQIRNDSMMLDLRDLPAGAYYIQLLVDGKRFAGKIRME
ncbi:MAG: hypothetical protein NW241_13610 [Bacteroidia bacterium]|nr:hypothetical protein [Bacteroidia bacterium]